MVGLISVYVGSTRSRRIHHSITHTNALRMRTTKVMVLVEGFDCKNVTSY